MARQVLPWVGLVVGAFFGQPQLGFAIGSIVGNAVDPQVIKGPQLGEAGVQTSAEGVFRPIVFGTAPVKGNVIERGNRQVKTKRTRQSKGGGPVTEEQRVFWTFAIRICEGPISNVTRIWMDEKLVYDIRPDSQIMEESAEFAERFRLYLGDEDQLPDPDLEAYKGIGNVNAYRGTAYAVFPNFDLTDYRERIPDFRWEVAGQTQTLSVDALMIVNSSPTIHTAVPSPDGYDWDANPYPNGTVPANANQLIALPGRYLACNIGGATSCTFSDDLGLTWNESGGESFVARGSGSYRDALVIIPADEGLARSVDNGATFMVSPDCGPVAIAIETDSNLLAIGGTIFRSADRGLSFEVGPSAGTSSNQSIGTDGVTVRFGGYLSSSPIIRETNGTTVSTMTLPALVGATTIRNICFGELPDGSQIWFAATDNGLVIRDDGTSGWELMPWVLDGGCLAIEFTGSGFLFASSGTSGIYDGALLWTERGDTTSVRATADPVQIISIATLPTLDHALGQPFVLGDFVAAMHQRAGHVSTDYDVSELTDEVDGIVLAGDYSCGSAISTMMPLYFFDASEFDGGSGYKIHYPKRGKPVVRTITIDDLIEAPEKTVREDALERPRVLHLHYESPQIGYAPAKATERRDSPDVLVVGERSFAVPVCFADQDRPRQINRKLMKVVWTEVAGEEEFTVHDGHLDLVTADCIGVSLRGQVRRMRITQEWLGLGEVKFKLMPDRQSAYTADVTGVPLPTPTPPPASQVGVAVFDYLDIPALNDTGDRLLYYVAATGQREAYAGTVVQLKEPSETDFADEVVITQPTVIGTLLDDITAASEHYTDTTNMVRVQLFRDEDLDSITDAQFLMEGGSFALEKADGSWEVLQYRDATDEGDRIFALTHLARGRLNTGASQHIAGARFVLLDSVYSVDAVTAWIGQGLTHRAVNIGRSPDGAAQYVDVYTAKSQTEFPVAHLFASKDGGTLNLSCVPRHRFGTEVHPVRSVNWVGYRWTATDGVNTATADGISNSQIFDVTGWSTPITCTVAQLNRYTGAGPTVTEQAS